METIRKETTTKNENKQKESETSVETPANSKDGLYDLTKEFSKQEKEEMTEPGDEEKIRIDEIKKELSDTYEKAAFYDHNLNSSEKEKADNERMYGNFVELRNILEKRKASKEVKNLFLDINVALVVAGVKPVSYIQPEVIMGNSLQRRLSEFFFKQNRLSLDDLSVFKSVCANLGVQMMEMDDQKYKKASLVSGRKYIYLWKETIVQQLLQKSDLFSEDEKKLGLSDVAALIHSVVDVEHENNIMSASIVRVGALYGYPEDDVADFLSFRKLREKYNISDKKSYDEAIDLLYGQGITGQEVVLLKRIKKHVPVAVRGMNGTSIGWMSCNFEFDNVKNTIEKMDRGIDAEKKAFNDSV